MRPTIRYTSKRSRRPGSPENMDERRMTNITIVQRPSVPTAPVVLNEQKILRGGFLAAIMLSLGVAFCFEFLPQTFPTPESVERKLRVPLLAALEHRKGIGGTT